MSRLQPNDFAILVRTNAQAAALECALLARKIPVRVAGSHGGVWATGAGRDVLAYLRAAEGRGDEDLTRVANKPLRFIRRDVVTTAARNGGNIIDALFRARDRAATRLAEDLMALAQQPFADRCKAVAELLIGDLKERAAEESKGAKSADADDDREATYKALAEAAAASGSVKAIDEQIAAMKKITDETPAVTISSIHRSKGAEWNTVYVAGVAEDVLPHKKAEDIEEERRLFYVAATRAKESLVLSVGGALPSSFLSETAGGPTPNDPTPRGGREVSDVNEAPAEVLTPSEFVASPEALAVEAAALACYKATHAAALPDGFDEETAMPSGLVPNDGTESILAVREQFDAAMSGARNYADRETAKEPPAGSGAGGRFVDVKLDDMKALLDGFTSVVGYGPTVFIERGQHTFTFTGPRGTIIKVYSTVAPGATVARGVGEDSIRVVALDAKTGKPVLPKEAWVARTRGWRVSLLDRIESVVLALFEQPECPKCSSLTAKRMRKSDGNAFNGCVRFPECRGVAS